MDKLVVNERGEATISNDGATIMKLLDVVHPAGRTLVDIAKSQDAEVGHILVQYSFVFNLFICFIVFMFLFSI